MKNVICPRSRTCPDDCSKCDISQTLNLLHEDLHGALDAFARCRDLVTKVFPVPVVIDNYGHTRPLDEFDEEPSADDLLMDGQIFMISNIDEDGLIPICMLPNRTWLYGTIEDEKNGPVFKVFSQDVRGKTKVLLRFNWDDDVNGLPFALLPIPTPDDDYDDDFGDEFDEEEDDEDSDVLIDLLKAKHNLFPPFANGTGTQLPS